MTARLLIAERRLSTSFCKKQPAGIGTRAFQIPLFSWMKIFPRESWDFSPTRSLRSKPFVFHKIFPKIADVIAFARCKTCQGLL
jgi:hypothetical protein